MMDWATQTVELPRWVIWGALLTQPAVWTDWAVSVIRRRLGTERNTPAES